MAHLSFAIGPLLSLSPPCASHSTLPHRHTCDSVPAALCCGLLCAHPLHCLLEGVQEVGGGDALPSVRFLCAEHQGAANHQELWSGAGERP